MRKKYLLWLIIAVFFFFVRLYRLPQNINFSADQGMGLLRSFEIWTNKELTLIGPTASPEVFGRRFFQGPLIYYHDIFIMLLAHWNPMRSSCILIILNFFGLLFLYQAVKILSDRQTAFIAAWIFAVWPTVIDFSRFHFGPTHLLYLTPLYLLWLAKILKTKSRRYPIMLGILAGLNLQFHYQSVIIILFTIIFLWWRLKNIRILIGYVAGFLIGYLPLIIFEVRNRFYNISTILLWLKQGGGVGLTFHPHRFLSFLPFLILFTAIILTKLKDKGRFLFWTLMLILTGNALFFTFKTKNAFGMPNGWNYPGLEKTKQIVLKENRTNFNIVNLLSGDTRFYSLRYLLTIEHKPPLPVDQYPAAKTLFILSYKNREDVLSHPVWEIQSFLPAQIVNAWPIQNNITFYQVNKLDNDN